MLTIALQKEKFAIQFGILQCVFLIIPMNIFFLIFYRFTYDPYSTLTGVIIYLLLPFLVIPICARLFNHYTAFKEPKNAFSRVRINLGIVLSLLLSILCFLQFYFNRAYFDDSNWTFSLWNCSQILSCVWALVTIKMVKYSPAREWNWILGIGIVVGLYLVTFINLIDFYFAMALVYAVYSIILYDISQKLTVNPIQEETQITYKNFAWVKKEMNKHCYVMRLECHICILVDNFILDPDGRYVYATGGI